MIHTYHITGMTCVSCQAKVQEKLSAIKGVTNAQVSLEKNEAEISMSTHIHTSTLQAALTGTKYQLTEIKSSGPQIFEEETKPLLETYKPIVLIFAFITAISFLVQINSPGFSWMLWMQHFMSGFFLTFSFFKLLNLSGFADSYATYDIIAKRWRFYGFIYAFIELALGLAFLIGFYPLITNVVTFVVMSISLVGVLQSVLNKRKIRCACLGDVFNLPMSTITIIEDALMILMSLFMIIYLTN